LKTCSRLKIAAVISLALLMPVLLGTADTAMAGAAAHAGSGTSLADRNLAATYVPVLYFHPDELFRPQPVDVMIGTSRLHRARRLWPDSRVLPRLTPSDLSRYTDASYFMDVWLGDEVASDYQNYTTHRDFYRSRLSPQAGGPSPLAYAHVVRDEDGQHITVQYWLFYWYNDAFNKHEGDWEMLEVVLTGAGEPEWVVLSQHHGGTRRAWSAAPIEDGTHPAVYVALGSHANYFTGNEIYISGMTVGNAHVEIADRTGTTGRMIPAVAVIPDRGKIEADPGGWPGLEWLLFRGHWGEQSSQRDFSGPLGPADKGDQWERPVAWGMAQPLDADAWYANRLRVQVLSQPGGSPRFARRPGNVDPVPVADSPRVTFRVSGEDALPAVETLGNLAVMHTDPISGTSVLADIEVHPYRQYDIVANWPDADARQIVVYRFDNVSLGADGRATLILRGDEPPVLIIPGRQQQLTGMAVRTRPAIWDVPDLMWVLGHLPAFDVVRGVVASLLAGLVPALLYLCVLYWADQYEKEPLRLLAAAFAWGALPALLVALVIRVFFQIPGGVVAPGTVERVSSGLVAPLLEETLIGGAVLFIAWRYRREFDGVLDGVIYGAVAGLGFAMTANMVAYLGAFLLYGFAGLGRTIWVDGWLYGLNHALYAAIFGAGLGYARLAQRSWERWAVPTGAFVLAIAIHAFHNLAMDSTMGWNLGTLVVTWAGLTVIIGVMVWSVRDQRRCLMAELAGEVPAALYRWLSLPAGCWLAEWHAFRRGGLRGLLQVRRAVQMCAKLAFVKMSGRQLGEPVAATEMSRLRKELQPLASRAALMLAS
jgi:RsiW-degrading membrane proteinase PrsW (M82 family)